MQHEGAVGERAGETPCGRVVHPVVPVALVDHNAAMAQCLTHSAVSRKTSGNGNICWFKCMEGVTFDESSRDDRIFVRVDVGYDRERYTATDCSGLEARRNGTPTTNCRTGTVDLWSPYVTRMSVLVAVEVGGCSTHTENGRRARFALRKRSYAYFGKRDSRHSTVTGFSLSLSFRQP